jgi:hypothetical protein
LKAAVFTSSLPRYLAIEEAKRPLPLPGIPDTRMRLIVYPPLRFSFSTKRGRVLFWRLASILFLLSRKGSAN